MPSIHISEFSLVVMIGASGSGKSSFAARHFKKSEVLELKRFQTMVGDESRSQSLNDSAFEILDFVLEKRLQHKRFTVIDAVNPTPGSRKKLRILAKKYHCPLVTLVLDMPVKLCEERQQAKEAGASPNLVRQQSAQIKNDLPYLAEEGFQQHHIFESPEALEHLSFVRTPLPSDRKNETGAFDIIGDVHGCLPELKSLLSKLGYEQENGQWKHPRERKIVFVGDLVNKGPDSVGCLKLAMELSAQGIAHCIPGNHDDKVLRTLQGQNIDPGHGLEATLKELTASSQAFHRAAEEFLSGLPHHIELDGGNLVVSHAGLKAEMHGRDSTEVRSFAMYGEVNLESDQVGLQTWFNWAEEYQGEALVVFGHAPVKEPVWQGNTVNIDTGCVYGGALTALRYPERKIESVAAEKTYWEPANKMAGDEGEQENRGSSLLDLPLFTDRNLVSTRYNYHITLKVENVPTVMEAVSRFRTNPRWMIYLPTPFSPPKSSKLPGLLEHPHDAFNYYRKKGLAESFIHDSGLGRRAILLVCKHTGAAQARFNTGKGEIGAVYDLYGQTCFDSTAAEQAFLRRVQAALDANDTWNRLQTDWICLEGEISPVNSGERAAWDEIHGRIADAGIADLDKSLAVLDKGMDSGLDLGPLARKFKDRREKLDQYTATAKAAGQGSPVFYMWHLVASEGRVNEKEKLEWHRDEMARFAEPGLLELPEGRMVSLDSDSSITDATNYWKSRTASTRAGMVVKPATILIDGGTDLIQPGLKVRGKDQLRLIFGPEYDAPGQLEHYRLRSLKERRMQAIRQYALAWETVHRFVEERPHQEIFHCFYIGLSLNVIELDPRN